MSFARFLGVVSAIVAATTVLAALTLGPGSSAAFGLGAFLSALNGVAAYGLVRWSQGRSNTAFMKAILGGLTLRLLAMLFAVFVALRVLGVAEVPFVASLLFHFVLLLALELWNVHRGGPALKVAA